MKNIVLVIVTFLLAGCTAQESTPEPDPTMTPAPTSTPVETRSPRPTATTAPTATSTRNPTRTPEPTERSIVEDAAPDDIVGIIWQWQAFQDTAGKNDIVVDEPEQYNLVLMSGGSASIQADCNQVSLGYILEGSSLSFSQSSLSTMAFCGEESLDHQYLALIADTGTWVMIDEGKLVFNLKLDAGNMIFENGGDAVLPPSQPEVVKPDITDVLWEWQSFIDTAGLNDITVDEPERYTFTLEADGTAPIQADCNQLVWGYALDSSSLSIDPTGPSTLAFCGEESLDQQYLDLLTNVATWVMTDDGRLFLNLWADGGDMVFAPSGSSDP